MRISPLVSHVGHWFCEESFRDVAWSKNIHADLEADVFCGTIRATVLLDSCLDLAAIAASARGVQKGQSLGFGMSPRTSLNVPFLHPPQTRHQFQVNKFRRRISQVEPSHVIGRHKTVRETFLNHCVENEVGWRFHSGVSFQLTRYRYWSTPALCLGSAWHFVIERTPVVLEAFQRRNNR